MVGKAGGKNDKARDDGHEGIQNSDIDRLAHQGALFANVTAEDGHAAHTQAEGEEGLGHGADDYVADAHFAHFLKVGFQVERQAFPSAIHGEAIDGQDHHNGQQCQHHVFADPLHPFLEAEGADEEAKHHHQGGKPNHAHRIGTDDRPLPPVGCPNR